MSHSIAGFYLYTPGAVPLQIRWKWTTKKQKPCLPSCKEHKQPQSADYSAGIYVSILFLVITNWNAYNLYIIPGPEDKITKYAIRWLQRCIVAKVSFIYLTDTL